MEIIYYKSSNGNFGDDLNPWLWPKIFPNNDITVPFVGIGTVLCSNNTLIDSLRKKKVIFFGSGIRPLISNNFIVDPQWDIRFVRGPLSALFLGNTYPYITDAAYAIRLIKEFNPYLNATKKYRMSFMPYFHSTKYLDWKKICSDLNIHYISPHSENGVDFTLLEIASSEYLITEAMHGAILADVFRVPWKRLIFSTSFTEGDLVSTFKWNDWLFSVKLFNCESIIIPHYKRTRISYGCELLTSDRVSAKVFNKRNSIKKAYEQLSNVNLERFDLSLDSTIQNVDEQMSKEIELLKRYVS